MGDPPLSPAPRKERSLLRRHGRFLKIAFSVSLLVYVYRTNGIQLDSRTLSGLTAPLWVILAGSMVLLVNPFLGASRWKVFLSYVGVSERRWGLIKIFFLSAFFGVLLPSSVGPDAVRMYLIEKKHPGSRGKTSATVVGERVWGFLLLSLFGLAGALMSVDGGGGGGLVWTMGILIVTLLLVLGVLTSTKTGGFLQSVLGSLRAPKGLSAYLSSVVRSLSEIPMGRVLPRALPFMILFQLSMIGLVWILFLAFGVSIPFRIHLAFVPVITIITILPASIGGFGLREGAFVHFYGLVDVPPDVSFSVSILLFLVTFGLTAVVGGIWALMDGLRRRDLESLEDDG